MKKNSKPANTSHSTHLKAIDNIRISTTFLWRSIVELPDDRNYIECHIRAKTYNNIQDSLITLQEAGYFSVKMIIIQKQEGFANKISQYLNNVLENNWFLTNFTAIFAKSSDKGAKEDLLVSPDVSRDNQVVMLLEVSEISHEFKELIKTALEDGTAAEQNRLKPVVNSDISANLLQGVQDFVAQSMNKKSTFKLQNLKQVPRNRSDPPPDTFFLHTM